MISHLLRILQEGGTSDSPLNSHQEDSLIQSDQQFPTSPISGFDFRFDHASFLGWVDDYNSIVEMFISGYEVETESISKTQGIHTFTHRYFNRDLGFWLEFYYDELFQMWFYRLELKGTYFSRILYRDSLRLFSFLKHSTKLKSCSRLDAALDDYRKINKVETYARNRKKVHGFRKFLDVKSGWVKEDDPNDTFYFGSPHSRKKLRIYNTIQTHEYDAVRYELELKEDYSNTYFDQVMSDYENYDRHASSNLEDDMAKNCVNYLFGAVDFLERKGKNLDRSKRCRFWQKLIDAVEAHPVKVRVAPIEWTVKKSVDWMYRQVAKTLLTIKRSVGAQVFTDKFDQLMNMFADSAEKRFTKADHLKVQAFREYFRVCT